MHERSSKRKARRDSLTSPLGDPEASLLRTENIPSISDRAFSEISEKTEKSICRRMKDTETGQREIPKMIENLSSKKDSSSNRTPVAANTETNEIDLVSPGSTPQLAEVYELPRDEGQHMVTGVTVSQTIPTKSSRLPASN